MKKILAAILLVLSLLVVTACAGNNSEPSDEAVSATDTSATDVSAGDIIPAPEGYTGCVVGDLYFCFPEAYTLQTASGTDAVVVYADTETGSNFSVSRSAEEKIVVSELSRTDLDRIGEQGAADIEASLGSGVDAVYTYNNHGTALDGKGVYFDFDVAVSYTDIDFGFELSYYQLYIEEGNELYVATFATNQLLEKDTAAVYFTDVIGSIKVPYTEE